MTWRTPREPEPFEIELVAIDVADGRAGSRPSRPPAAGVGTIPSATELLRRAIHHAGSAAPPRLGPDQHQIHPWPELRIHRLVRLPLPLAERALLGVLETRRQLIRPPAGDHHLGGPVPVLSPLARLHVGHGRRLGADLDGVRVDGALRVHRHGHPTPVEVMVEAWSDSASDLSLQVRGRRRPAHLPRRYFDVAHRVMDDLWHQIEAVAPSDIA